MSYTRAATSTTFLAARMGNDKRKTAMDSKGDQLQYSMFLELCNAVQSDDDNAELIKSIVVNGADINDCNKVLQNGILEWKYTIASVCHIWSSSQSHCIN